MFELLSSKALHEELMPSLQRLDEKKKTICAQRPLPPAFVESIEHKLEIELTHASISIEGNTLTLRETQLLIDEGITPSTAKEMRELYEAVNHYEALDHLKSLISSCSRPDTKGLCELHRHIMARIDDERSGSWRHETVFVTGAPRQPMRAEKIADAMLELEVWLQQPTLHPIIEAVEAHYRFVKIHPFYDGNGRTARLLMNWILLRNDFPLTVIPSEQRSRYLESLDNADRGHGGDFFRLVIECVESSLDQYLAGL